MEKSNFDELMERYLAGKVTAHERLKIEAWLEVMKTERTTDLEFTNADQERLFKKITDTISNADDIIALHPRPARMKRLFSQQWVQVAASVAILLTVSFTVWNLVGDSSRKEKVILNDGSIVWLKEGSKFAYYEKDDGTRHARLTGEALFEVAKIPNSSFTIVCDKINVGVIGTSFSLKTGEERIELNVLTGKVKLTSEKDTVGISVEPNQKVIYTTGGEINQLVLTGKEVAVLTENTEYNMKFTKTAMEDVIESIARKFDVTISVGDEALNNCHISADFTDNSLENTLKILSDMLGISYTINDKHITLSGKGC
jgi:transmembrane sensor